MMDRGNILPARLNAMWFTYIAVFLFVVLPTLKIELGILEIFGYSLLGTFVVNLAIMYKNRLLMDEKDQRMSTEAMAWSFVAVSLALVSAGTTGIQLDIELIRDIASLGLWIYIIVFSLKSLYRQYGDK